MQPFRTGILNSFMISGIAGRSMVSEKKTVRSVLLSIARVNHAWRPTVIPSVLSPIRLMSPFLAMVICPLEQKRAVVVAALAVLERSVYTSSFQIPYQMHFF